MEVLSHPPTPDEGITNKLSIPPEVTDGIIMYSPYIGGNYSEYTSAGLKTRQYRVGPSTGFDIDTPVWVVWHNLSTGEAEWSPPLTERTLGAVNRAIEERGLTFEDD